MSRPEANAAKFKRQKLRELIFLNNPFLLIPRFLQVFIIFIIPVKKIHKVFCRNISSTRKMIITIITIITIFIIFLFSNATKTYRTKKKDNGVCIFNLVQNILKKSGFIQNIFCLLFLYIRKVQKRGVWYFTK